MVHLKIHSACREKTHLFTAIIPALLRKIRLQVLGLWGGNWSGLAASFCWCGHSRHTYT